MASFVSSLLPGANRTQNGKSDGCGFYVRRASHAGSWYTNDSSELRSQLDSWLASASDYPAVNVGAVRAVIAPHAGYRFSGPTAGHAYKQITPLPKGVRRIFVLGPAHHVHIDGCAVSGASVLETPIGNLAVDISTVRDILRQNGSKTSSSSCLSIRILERDEDEDEHSIEMHLPFVARIISQSATLPSEKLQTGLSTNRGAGAGSRTSADEGLGSELKVVPIVVGALSATKEAAFGALLAPYFADTSNIFIISSDFCHWGRRFNYQPVDKAYPPDEIWRGIEAMDRRGMGLIEDLDTAGFQAYIASTRNTVCGRHPIAVLLSAIEHLQARASTGSHCQSTGASSSSAASISAVAKAPPGASHAIKFLKYAQSSKVTGMGDSSVSYAAAVVTLQESR